MSTGCADRIGGTALGALERGRWRYQEWGRIMLSLIVVFVALLAVGTAWIWLPLLSMLADRLADETWRDKQVGSAETMRRRTT